MYRNYHPLKLSFYEMLIRLFLYSWDYVFTANIFDSFHWPWSCCYSAVSSVTRTSFKECTGCRRIDILFTQLDPYRFIILVFTPFYLFSYLLAFIRILQTFKLVHMDMKIIIVYFMISCFINVTFIIFSSS